MRLTSTQISNNDDFTYYGIWAKGEWVTDANLIIFSTLSKVVAQTQLDILAANGYDTKGMEIREITSGGE